MTDWVRLWHDMPTDPKWRVIARKSGQPLACVVALFTMMLTNASGNSAERGALLGWDDEDAAAALDMDGEQVTAIRSAMQGKVLDGQRLTGWERRQPKREDGTSAERKAAWKERKATERNASERNGTQWNAPETDAETETETDKTVPLDKSNGAAIPKVDPIKAIFDEGRDLLIASGVGAKQAGSLVGKWRRDHGDGALMEVFTAARSRGLTNPVEWITRGLAARGNERRVSSGRASIEATAPCL